MKQNIKMTLILMIILILVTACSRNDKTYSLNFTVINYIKLNEFNESFTEEIIKEAKVNEEITVYLYKDKESNQINGRINMNDKYHNIGEVSMDSMTDELYGIKEVQLFGKKAVKIYGILGANYAKSYYWFYKENLENSLISVDGNTTEIDLNNDNQNEIISTTGTIPETKIYMVKDDKIVTADVNESIGAKSVIYNENENLFEVYFEANKFEYYVLKEGQFTKNIFK